MKAEHLLARASAVVAHRRGIYGAPDFLFQRMATRWSQVLGTRSRRHRSSAEAAEETAAAEALLKSAEARRSAGRREQS